MSLAPPQPDLDLDLDLDLVLDLSFPPARRRPFPEIRP